MAKKELTRKEYEKIKRMDHHAMKCYIENVYQSGYDAGARAGRSNTQQNAGDRSDP